MRQWKQSNNTANGGMNNMAGRRETIAKRFYHRTYRLERLLLAIFSHPTTDPIIKERIKAEFYGTEDDRRVTTIMMKEICA